MEVLAVLMMVGLVVLILTLNSNPETIAPTQPEVARVMPVKFDKVVEATEEATELPDGTVLTLRKIRQWH